MTVAMPEPEAVLPAALADLTEPELISVRSMLDALIRAGEASDPDAEASLLVDGEAVTMTLTVSVPRNEAAQ